MSEATPMSESCPLWRLESGSQTYHLSSPPFLASIKQHWDGQAHTGWRWRILTAQGLVAITIGSGEEPTRLAAMVEVESLLAKLDPSKPA